MQIFVGSTCAQSDNACALFLNACFLGVLDPRLDYAMVVSWTMLVVVAFDLETWKPGNLETWNV